MARIEVETFIRAPAELCFDMARDIGLHEKTCLNTQEKAVDGVTSGCIELGQTVTFEAKHLAIRQRLTSKIVEFERPHKFVDEMQKGAFNRMRHEHLFKQENGGTRMIDILDFASPLGPLGALVDWVFLSGYMCRFLIGRNERLKELIEAAASQEPRTSESR
jgi:ligand-binding SRPBCC domain-containing protein